MVFSEKKNFNVHVCVSSSRNSNDFSEPLNETATSVLQSNGIVLAEHDLEFCLRIYARDGLENEAFTSKIFIDDQLIGPPKTFCGSGFVKGYKIETGLFRRFVFKIPKVIRTESSVEADSLAKMGSIRIDFFTTVKLKKKGKTDPLFSKNTFSFEEKGRPDTKKLYKKSLAVGLGRIVRNTASRLNHLKYDQATNTYWSYGFGKESKLIDSVLINYADYDSLLLLGYISIYNVNHMAVIPPMKLRLPHVIDSVLTGIIKHEKRPLKLDELDVLFQKYCDVPFERTNLGVIGSFVSRRGAFQIDENGFIRLQGSQKEEQESLSTKRMNNLPLLVHPKYLKKPEAPENRNLVKRIPSKSAQKLENELICLD